MSTKHALDPHLEEADDEYMAVYRDSDVGRLSHTELRKRNAQSKSCGADELTFNTDSQHPVHKEILARSLSTLGEMSPANIFGKRQTNIDGGAIGNGNSAGVNLRSTIGDTSGCPSSRRVALVGVATDCTYTAAFNSTDTMRQNIINIVNTASDLYQSTFNITLGLRNLTVSPAECPATPADATRWNVGCSDSYTITNRLNDFSSWRGNLAGDTNAYWSLFTTCNTGAEVGLAWLGQLCNHGGTNQQGNGGATQTVTGANVIARTNNEWQVFAHESGHTFGAVHDCDSSACADSSAVETRFNPPVLRIIVVWSLSQAINVVTVLSKKARTVIVAVQTAALAMHAATQTLANSMPEQSVIQATKAVARISANLQLPIRCAGLRQDSVIHRKPVQVRTQLVRQIRLSPTARTVAMVYIVLVANVHLEISSARL
ncbi:hypothetical protein LTR51_005653 [Lithohypha guttulata]|nr:hypothetical protein LTR51_005653 [Lithohypha guttulata]